ncbi:MAG TPA: Uma2 family endonuclease [Tepidisphaeraceae bacterium]|nr:Uma2 family endonuclease [Tepidisphaeraceae bacterium]
MTVVQTTPPPQTPPVKYANGAEWLHALGDVPLTRVVMDPPPGTATEHDLLILVERDKRLVELIDGTLVEKPVGFDESEIASRLNHFLLTWILPRDLGAVYGEAATMRMKRGRVRLPDVAFISTERLASLPDPHPAIPTIAPDLAVEVLSVSNTRAEIRQKLREYFESGTTLAWVIDPLTRTVAVYEGAPEEPVRVMQENETLDGGKVLPGFSVPVAYLFPRPKK